MHTIRALLLSMAGTALLCGVGCKRDESRSAATQPAGPPVPVYAVRPGTVTVFAAASLTEAFTEMKPAFEQQHPGAAVVYNFGGSQQLRGQIEHGAPADVFASANTRETDALAAGGHLPKGIVRRFAGNRLVVIHPAAGARGGDATGASRVRALADLARPGVRIDVADPAVPAGTYTLRMLDAMAKDPAYGEPFKRAFLKNVVSREENVKVVVRKVQLGEADAGVAYASDVGVEVADRVGTIAVPDAFNQLAEYPIAPLAKAQRPDLAERFVAFVLSPHGQGALGRRGFVTLDAIAGAATSPGTRPAGPNAPAATNPGSDNPVGPGGSTR